MATSGTYSFSPEIAEIVDEAFERCGIDPASLTQRHTRSARRSMDLLFSEWANKGPHLWAIDQQIFTVTQGTEIYETPVGTIGILEMALRVDSIDTEINPMTRDEYLSTPNKSTQGFVSRYWFERINPDTSITYPLGTPRIHLWNVPDNSTDQIVYYRMRQIQDSGAASNTLDIPHRWQEAIAAGLAKKLAVKFAPDRIGPLTGEANSRFNEAKSEDRESAPTTFRVKYGVGVR